MEDLIVKEFITDKKDFYDVAETIVMFKCEIDCRSYANDMEEVTNLLVRRQTAVYRALNNHW